MGYSAYFLITWDWINWAKSQGIPIGPGRGSAAGSLVAYTLAITDLDPMRYGLLFERFLNPDRVSMPDIDTDVAQYGREQCIQYLTEKYGADRVAQIATFGRMLPKAAVKDAARVMDLPVAVGEQVSKLIPDGPGQSFDKNLAAGMDLRKAYDTDATVKSVVDLAMPLEGVVRNTGIHAAAVVIGAQPLTEVVPLRGGEHGGQRVTQFEQSWVELLGLLKMDVLGLRNLDVLQKVVAFVKDSRGEELDVAALPLDDALTYEMIARGDTTGVFQLESEGMQAAARQIKPTVFEDIVALGALYRPGPMAYIPVYAKNKHNPEQVTFPDERLKDILEETHGITVYQEQYMMIARVLAGFTPGQADDLRKGIAKKKRDILDRIKPMFLNGCKENGVDTKVAQSLWDDAEKAGDYSFNKSHAACYGLISYQTAYLKAHYPAEYMAGLISSVMHTKDKVPFFVNACRQMGIRVLPPSVNESVHDFRVVGDDIRFGLSAVKGVGTQAIDAIIAARADGGHFTNLWDFCERVDKMQANKRVLEALIKAGAFDDTGDTRKGMLEVLPQAMAAGAKLQEDAANGQFDLFGGIGGAGADDANKLAHPPIPTREFSRLEQLDLEREVTGLYMSGHPIDEWRDAIDSRTEHAIGDVLATGEEIMRRAAETGIEPKGVRRGAGGERIDDRPLVKVGGLVSDYRALVTKTGKPMAFFTLDGTDGQSARVVVFNSVFEVCREKLQGERRVVILRGRLEAKDGSIDLMAETVLTLDEAPQLNCVTVSATHDQLGQEKVIGELTRILRNYPGEATVDVRAQAPDGAERLLRLGDAWRVSVDAGLKDEIRELLGPNAVV
jgi:DNA polymerase-3 subunit alpha